MAHRGLSYTIGPEGTQPPLLSAPCVAFRPSTASLYALDLKGIYGFDASAPPAYPLPGRLWSGRHGAEVDEPGFAVDTTKLSSAGNLYFVSEERGKDLRFCLYRYRSRWRFPDRREHHSRRACRLPADLCGAAVDATGQIWVSNYDTGQVLRYSSAGAFQGALDLSAQGLRPCHLAFDSNDDLYVTNGNGSTGQETWRYTASSGYTAATLIDSEGGTGLAFNPTDHHVFIANSNKYVNTTRLATSRDLRRQRARRVLQGLTVDPATNHVFLLDGAHNVSAYMAPDTFLLKYPLGRRARSPIRPLPSTAPLAPWALPLVIVTSNTRMKRLLD